MKKQHSLPTVAGLLVLIIGVAVGVFLVQSKRTLTTSASVEETPKNVKITNITDKSFTVSWTTAKKTPGLVSFGKSETLDQTSGESAPSSFHHITVANLAPRTNYLFKIGSGENIFDNNGDFYQVKTGPTLGTLTKNDFVAFGTIQDSLGTAAAGVLVYATLPGASPLSAQTDSKGSWVIPLSSTRTSTLTSFASYGGNSNLAILVQSASQTASAQILVSSARPVPPITLGKTYNFTDVKSPESSSLPSSNIQLAISTVSLTPTPTASPTFKPTPTPTKKPTPTPTIISAPTVLPDAGDLTPTLALTIMSLALFTAGFLLAKI